MNKPQVVEFRKESYPAFQNAKGVFLGNDKIEKGTCLEVLLHPYVIEEEEGKFIEVADLELHGGEILYNVPFAHFKFCEEGRLPINEEENEK